MIYYIDVQPVRKKTGHSFKKLRIWVYPTALLLSLFVALTAAAQHEGTVPAVIISKTDLAAAPSESVQELSVSTPVLFCAPVDTAYISSRYGYRTNPISGEYRLHGGLDLACGEGSPIYAVTSGIITTAKYSDSYGNYIVIDHNNGCQTLYAHCSELLKGEGENVSQGDIIALVGSTGNSTGPHLHIEVRIDGERTDPEEYFGDYYQ